MGGRPARDDALIMKRYASTLIALVLIATAGCSNAGSSSGLIPLNSSQVTPARDAHRANVVMRIRIPKRTRKRARYVSPATVSAMVKITPKAGCGSCSPAQTLKPALVASSPQCKATSAQLTCSIAIDLRAGAYTGSLTTYDSSGATLSENQSFPVSISAGKANTVGVTLYGVPAGVNVTLVDPTRGSQSFDASGQETIDIAGGNAPAQLLITAVDSDDYVIAGPGAPTMSFAISGSSGFKAASTPGLPEVATITTPSTRTSNTDKLVVILGGAACSLPHATCAGSVTLGLDTLIASAAGDSVEVETPQGGVVSAITLSPGSAPTSLAFDSHGNLFVAGSNMKTSEYAWPYRNAPVATFGKPTFGTACPGMVIDRSDDVLVGQLGGISMYAPPYTGTPKSQAFVAPQCLALDGLGNLYYVTAYGGGIIIAIPPPFFTGAYNALATTGTPTSIAADPVDNIVAVIAGTTLSEYDPSLNSIGSTSVGSGTTNVAYGGGYFAVGYGTGAYGVWKASGFGYMGGYSFGGTSVGTVAFDSQTDLLIALPTGMAFYDAPFNTAIRTNFVLTANPAKVVATWP